MRDLRFQHEKEPTKLPVLQHSGSSRSLCHAFMQDGKIFVLLRQRRMGNLVCLLASQGGEKRNTLPHHLFKLPSFPQKKLNTFIKISANVIT